ncbi:MAG: hypothetical protein ACO295_00510 [Sediminibacterium sp.]
MEILRTNTTTSLNATFSGLVPSSQYTIEYEDLLNGETYSASATSNGNGAISFSIPDYYLNYDAVLDARVINYLDEAVIVDSLNIVRPYCNLSEVATRLDITLANAIDLERKARIIIDNETMGFRFSRKEKEYVGNNSDYLVVDEKIYKLYKLYENKELIYDVDSNINDSEYEISKDGSSIVLKTSPTNRVDYSKVWRDRYLDSDFADGYDYLVDADFGWKVIPEDIKYACEVLMNDLNSDSFKYIGKYITQFDNEDFKVKFADTFTKGTGNLVVDKILSKYKNYIRAGVL